MLPIYLLVRSVFMGYLIAGWFGLQSELAKGPLDKTPFLIRPNIFKKCMFVMFWVVFCGSESYYLNMPDKLSARINSVTTPIFMWAGFSVFAALTLIPFIVIEDRVLAMFISALVFLVVAIFIAPIIATFSFMLNYMTTKTIVALFTLLFSHPKKEKSKPNSTAITTEKIKPTPPILESYNKLESFITEISDWPEDKASAALKLMESTSETNEDDMKLWLQTLTSTQARFVVERMDDYTTQLEIEQLDEALDECYESLTPVEALTEYSKGVERYVSYSKHLDTLYNLRLTDASFNSIQNQLIENAFLLEKPHESVCLWLIDAIKRIEINHSEGLQFLEDINKSLLEEMK